jgi:AraC family transcriptional activator of mtrCDE
MPVHGRLDLRCFYGAPWRIEWGPGAVGEIPYRAIVRVGPCE